MDPARFPQFVWIRLVDPARDPLYVCVDPVHGTSWIPPICVDPGRFSGTEDQGDAHLDVTDIPKQV